MARVATPVASRTAAKTGAPTSGVRPRSSVIWAPGSFTPNGKPVPVSVQTSASTP